MTCSDVNECDTDNGGCSQKCINEPGNRSCGCFEGFRVSGRNGTDILCQDIGKYKHSLANALLVIICMCRPRKISRIDQKSFVFELIQSPIVSS